MLALVSSITTAVNGCDAFENCVSSTGLPSSVTVKSALLEIRHQTAAAVDDRRVDRDLGTRTGPENLRRLLRGRHLGGAGFCAARWTIAIATNAATVAAPVSLWCISAILAVRESRARRGAEFHSRDTESGNPRPP